MKPNTQRLLRRYHHYLGLFFAPMIILFAFSGALQTFRLQEEKGYGGTPPGWIVWIASIHKDSRLPTPREAEASKPRPQSSASWPDAPRTEATKPATAVRRPYTLPLKIFVVLLSLALIASTVLGVVIALTNRAMRRASLILLGAGAIVPAVLLLL
jgi:uncharacterized iron-regulated membrane protein